MAQPTRFSSEHMSGMAVLRDVPLDGLRALTKLLNDDNKRVVSPSKLRELAKGSLADRSSSNELIKQLLVLATYVRRFSESATQVVDRFMTSVEVYERWMPEQLEELRQRRADIIALVDSVSLKYTAKALDLAFDRERIFNKSRIITDIRPVFDSEKQEIVGAVVIQSLRIEYYSEDGFHSSTFSLSTKDIEDLLSACQDALEKKSKNLEAIEMMGDMDAFAAGDEAPDVD